MEALNHLSLKQVLDEIELNLRAGLNISVPDDCPNDVIKRFERIVKILMGLDRVCVIELLPKVLMFLADKESYGTVVELLNWLTIEGSEDVLEVVVQGTSSPVIKKECLGVVKILLDKQSVQGSHRVIYSLAGVLNDSDKETAMMAREVGRKLRDSIFRTIPPVRQNTEKAQLVFGVLPQQLLKDFYENDSKKEKISAVKSIEEIICNLNDTSILIPYEAEIVQLINELIMDNTKGFVSSGLRICVCLCKHQEFNLCKLNTILKYKIGDPVIGIRQCAFKILLHNLKFFETFPNELLSGFDSENWHIREETVNLVIGALLLNMKIEGVDLIASLAKLLDDEKSKVRQVTIEAFTVISKLHGRENLLDQLRQLVDEIAMRHITDRLELEVIPSIINNLIHFPRIIPTSAPVSFITKSSFSPFPTPTSTQEFNFSSGLSSIIASPAPRSSSLQVKKQEPSSMIRQSSEFLKPPLPTRGMKRSLPSLSSAELKKSTTIDTLYTDWSNLSPIDNPSEAFTTALLSIESNWEHQFEYINTFRSVAKNHKDLLNSQTLHKVMLELLRFADSLRSALSKNALSAIGEICKELPKYIDSDLDAVLSILIRKSVDTNTFIAETALDSLMHCVMNCAIAKVIQCVLSNIAQAKSGMIKSRLAFCSKFVLLRVVVGPIPSGVDRIVISMAAYVQEAASEVRDSARECFIALGKDLDRILLKFLTESTCKSVKEVLEKDAKRRTFNHSAEPMRTNTRSFLKRSPVMKSSSGRLRISQTLEKDMLVIKEINEALHSEDWKLRFNAIDKISAGILEEITNKNSGKILSLIDSLCKTITDQNTKVVQHSVETLKDLLPQMTWALQPNISLLISSLVVTLGSSNIVIREISKEICQGIVGLCEKSYVIAPFTSAINVANPRARAVLIGCVVETLERVHEKKPTLIQKIAVPLLYRIIDDPTPDVRDVTERLAVKLHGIIGDGLFKVSAENKSIKIQEIIKKYA